MKKNAAIFFLLLSLVGCSSREKVQHLSSDICQLMPATTTRTDVEKHLGAPAVKKVDPTDNHEIWLYYKVNKSFLKKVPLLGRRFGYEEYELVVIDFNSSAIRKCIYRTLTREEMIAQGVVLDDQ